MARVLQLKISLKGIKPSIWRRFLVSDFWTFDKLHRVIQKIMGWGNYHLYEFKIDDVRITLPDEDYITKVKLLNSQRIKIFEYLNSVGQKFEYFYDFGDGWGHEIKIEKVTEDTLGNRDELPFCIGGVRACPLEDCGGIGGYERFIDFLRTGKDPYGENASELREWLGDWDPEKFDLEEINRDLKKK